MGYRSDVAYIVKFESFQDRDAYVSLLLAKNDDFLTRAIEDTDHERTDQPVITYHETDIKWYPEFEDVRAHTHIYKYAYEVYDAVYRCVRVGEDGYSEITEIDDTGELMDAIYPVHRLVVDF
jgi:hypothetical protein